jgi:esterase/lipase superfamily enzyme
MKREYYHWWSPSLGREMELLVFGHAGPRMLVFPSRKQRFYEYEDAGMVHSLRHSLEAGKLQLVCVDGVDGESLYCFDISPEERIARHLQFERYILEEVLPFSADLNPRTPLFAHGCSFGAYHATTIALRHPEYFQRVLAFSGRYDLTLQVGEYPSLFHGYEGKDIMEIMPAHFLPITRNEKLLRKMRRIRFTMVVGEDDPFCENNAKLCQMFSEKKIPHELHLWCGEAHRFRYWRQMVRVYL